MKQREVGNYFVLDWREECAHSDIKRVNPISRKDSVPKVNRKLESVDLYFYQTTALQTLRLNALHLLATVNGIQYVVRIEHCIAERDWACIVGSKCHWLLMMSKHSQRVRTLIMTYLSKDYRLRWDGENPETFNFSTQSKGRTNKSGKSEEIFWEHQERIQSERLTVVWLRGINTNNTSCSCTSFYTSPKVANIERNHAMVIHGRADKTRIRLANQHTYSKFVAVSAHFKFIKVGHGHKLPP